MFKVGNKGFDENPFISLIPFQIGYVNRCSYEKDTYETTYSYNHLYVKSSFESKNTIFYCFDILEGE